MSPTRRGFLHTTLALATTTAAWAPVCHWLFDPDPADFDPGRLSIRGRGLLEGQLARWRDGDRTGLDRMRATNPEWDFMARTLLVLSLANLGVAGEDHVATIDRIVADTLDRERRYGHNHFLLPYASASPWVHQPPRSLFVDGEIALMLGARRLVLDDATARALFQERIRVVAERLHASPFRCAESYPDECWLFCNTAALAALRMAEVLDGDDHQHLFDEWLAIAGTRLTDPETGILLSSWHLDGRPVDGPEGSTIFAAAHFLQAVDPNLAADQYRRARSQLGASFLGFGWAREWPASWRGPDDVDSGPTVPIIGASAGSSGLALVGAAAFGDTATLRQLLRSLDLAGFPVWKGDALHYAAANQLGDAVTLYALTLGPLWSRIQGVVA